MLRYRLFNSNCPRLDHLRVTPVDVVHIYLKSLIFKLQLYGIEYYYAPPPTPSHYVVVMK